MMILGGPFINEKMLHNYKKIILKCDENELY